MENKKIEQARLILESKWDSEGCCPSCGWHGCLYEHRVDDYDIKEALSNDGILELSCISKDDEYSYHHRKIKIDIFFKELGE